MNNGFELSNNKQGGNVVTFESSSSDIGNASTSAVWLDVPNLSCTIVAKRVGSILKLTFGARVRYAGGTQTRFRVVRDDGKILKITGKGLGVVSIEGTISTSLHFFDESKKKSAYKVQVYNANVDAVNKTLTVKEYGIGKSVIGFDYTSDSDTRVLNTVTWNTLLENTSVKVIPKFKVSTIEVRYHLTFSNALDLWNYLYQQVVIYYRKDGVAGPSVIVYFCPSVDTSSWWYEWFNVTIKFLIPNTTGAKFDLDLRYNGIANNQYTLRNYNYSVKEYKNG